MTIKGKYMKFLAGNLKRLERLERFQNPPVVTMI